MNTCFVCMEVTNVIVSQSMLLWFRVWTYQQRICLSVSDSLQCWMWMWGWTGHDLYSGTLVWHIQTVPVLGSTSLSLLQCQTKTWCHLALVQMGHKSGQVSHQEWSHSWEPAALYLDDYIQFMQHGIHKDVIGVCTCMRSATVCNPYEGPHHVCLEHLFVQSQLKREYFYGAFSFSKSLYRYRQINVDMALRVPWLLLIIHWICLPLCSQISEREVYT